MQIKTRFNIGDRVCFLKGMTIVTMQISEIHINAVPVNRHLEDEESGIKIRYMDNEKGYVMLESYLYKDKEELLKSIGG